MYTIATSHLSIYLSFYLYQGDKTDNDHDSLNLSESNSVTSLVATGMFRFALSVRLLSVIRSVTMK